MTNKELTLSGIKLNIVVFFMVAPIWFLVSGGFVYWVGWHHYWNEISQALHFKIVIILFGGVLVHELLHAITWMVLNGKGFRNVWFGFNSYSFTPYTHFRRPMKVWKYALGGAMPGLLMGVIPGLLSYFLKSATLNFIGFLFLWTAGGDIISLWTLRKLNSNQYVQDHPEKMGCIVIEPEIKP